MRQPESIVSAPERNDGGPGGRRIEVIDYADQQPLVDHKGRSKPMYKASRPRPETWRPSKVTRLLLGMFPGARAMALSSVLDGALYVVLGVAAIVAVVMLSVTWSRTYDTFINLAMEQHWLLVHVAAWLGAIALYEVLRLLSAIDESIRGPIAPRILATFFFPAVAVLLAAPKIVWFYPRLVEATFCAALVLLCGALPAAIWSIGMALLRSRAGHRRLGYACAGIAALAITALVLTATLAGPDTIAALEARGFELLPALLG